MWRQFHCDLKDVTSWMTHAEKVLEDTSGEIEFNAAKKEQKVRRCENKKYLRSFACMQAEADESA